ncbi:hypothetical protein DFJ73DRAFT_949662, partial [Zopfochytrium polystomum]
ISSLSESSPLLRPGPVLVGTPTPEPITACGSPASRLAAAFSHCSPAVAARHEHAAKTKDSSARGRCQGGPGTQAPAFRPDCGNRVRQTGGPRCRSCPPLPRSAPLRRPQRQRRRRRRRQRRSQPRKLQRPREGRERRRPERSRRRSWRKRMKDRRRRTRTEKRTRRKEKENENGGDAEEEGGNEEPGEEGKGRSEEEGEGEKVNVRLMSFGARGVWRAGWPFS